LARRQRLGDGSRVPWPTEEEPRAQEPETLDAELLQEEEDEAKAEAERARPGLTMFTDGSRMEDGAAGYSVVWKNGQSWAGIKTLMGYNQEAYDAECAALARALESASRRNMTPEGVTIFTDAQAAIRRMASHEPGPGQQYALQARKHIAALRRAQAGHHHRNLMVFSPQGDRRQREGRQVGQDCGGGARHPGWNG